jgi:V/A-type H+-transporting ATPase subunit F
LTGEADLYIEMNHIDLIEEETDYIQKKLVLSYNCPTKYPISVDVNISSGDYNEVETIDPEPMTEKEANWFAGKTAIVGSGDAIMVFKAVGVDTFPAENDKKARDVIRKIAKEYQVIFLMEELARPLTDFLKRFDEEPYPVILPIPSGAGSTGYGQELLKNAMERALGVDILFNRN